MVVKLVRKRDLTEKQVQLVKQEFEIVRTLSHQNIAKVIDAFESEHHLHYIYEDWQGGSLFDRVIKAG